MPIDNVPHEANINESLRGWLERARQTINRPRRPIYIPVTQFSGYLGNQFLGVGTPNLEEINSLKIVGARIEAVNDACHHVFYVPKDMNVGTNVKFEVLWCTNSGTTSQTATWKIEYAAIKPESEALSAASTALSSAIIADNVLGAYKPAITPYGYLSKNILEHGDLLHLKVSLGAVSGLNPASDILFLLGILINDEG